ncbi:MAG: ATP-grasp domain-containing protein [Planctomycetota bacterium]
MADRPARLAIVGASVRAAAFSAQRAGLRVVAADLFADEDLRRCCPATRVQDYPAGLAGWLAQQDVDAWMYTGAIENHPELVDRMAGMKPLWGNPGRVLRRCRDPLHLQAVCAEFAVEFPATTREPPPAAAGAGWLAKTYRGSSGSGVAWLVDTASRQAALASRAVYQRLVAGTPAAAAYVVGADGAELLSVTRQLVGLADFGASRWAYCGSLVEPSLAPRLAEPLRRIGRLLHEGLRLRGLVGVDLVVEEAAPGGPRVWLIEVNPRCTASMEVGEGPISFVGRHARVFGCQQVGHDARATPAAAKGVVFAKQPVGVSRAFHDWAMRESVAGRLADIPAAGADIPAGAPVVTVLVRGAVGDARGRLTAAVAAVESRLY